MVNCIAFNTTTNLKIIIGNKNFILTFPLNLNTYSNEKTKTNLPIIKNMKNPTHKIHKKSKYLPIFPTIRSKLSYFYTNIFRIRCATVLRILTHQPRTRRTPICRPKNPNPIKFNNYPHNQLTINKQARLKLKSV